MMETSSLCIVDNKFHLCASNKGLHFNAANGYCDHPMAANCGVGSIED